MIHSSGIKQAYQLRREAGRVVSFRYRGKQRQGNLLDACYGPNGVYIDVENLAGESHPKRFLVKNLESDHRGILLDFLQE